MDSRSPANIMTGKADVDLSRLSKATKDRVLMNPPAPPTHTAGWLIEYQVKKHALSLSRDEE